MKILLAKLRKTNTSGLVLGSCPSFSLRFSLRYVICKLTSFLLYSKVECGITSKLVIRPRQTNNTAVPVSMDGQNGRWIVTLHYL